MLIGEGSPSKGSFNKGSLHKCSDVMSTHPEGRGKDSEATPAVLPQMIGMWRNGAEHEYGPAFLIWGILYNRARREARSCSV